MTGSARSASRGQVPAASRIVLAVPLVLVALALGGCRGGDRPALSAPASTVAPGPAADPVAGDPLAGVESAVDAVERELDADADADPVR